MFRVGLAVVAVIAYFALVWFLAVRRERRAARDAKALGFSFTETQVRYAGTFCSKCGHELAAGEVHLVHGGWTCPAPPRAPRQPVSFRQPAAKGFRRGHVA